MERKGQGTFEYVLLAAGVLLIVALGIAVVRGWGLEATPVQDNSTNATNDSPCITPKNDCGIHAANEKEVTETNYSLECFGREGGLPPLAYNVTVENTRSVLFDEVICFNEEGEIVNKTKSTAPDAWHHVSYSCEMTYPFMVTPIESDAINSVFPAVQSYDKGGCEPKQGVQPMLYIDNGSVQEYACRVRIQGYREVD